MIAITHNMNLLPYIGKENKLQEAVINWLRYNGYYCFHVPNGGKRDGKSGAMFKKQGVLLVEKVH